MFTGIIETIGIVDSISKRGNNLDITILSSISKDLQPDKSVSHNGVCLTITKSNKTSHSVTLVNETLNKSNFLTIKKGSIINLERSLLATDRMDGHFVQGHVDDVARCIEIIDNKKSWNFEFDVVGKYIHKIIKNNI